MSLLTILERIDEELEINNQLTREYVKLEMERKVEPKSFEDHVDQVVQTAQDRLDFIILGNKRLRLDMKINDLQEKLYQ